MIVAVPVIAPHVIDACRMLVIVRTWVTVVAPLVENMRASTITCVPMARSVTSCASARSLPPMAGSTTTFLFDGRPVLVDDVARSVYL